MELVVNFTVANYPVVLSLGHGLRNREYAGFIPRFDGAKAMLAWRFPSTVPIFIAITLSPRNIFTSKKFGVLKWTYTI